MKIADVRLHRLRIPFRTPFGHALQQRSQNDTILVEVESEGGDTGIGEVLPRSYVTGETLGSVEDSLGRLAGLWQGTRFECPESVVFALYRELDQCGRQLASMSGWELAVLDLAGKTFHFDVGEVLGTIIRAEIPAGAVIDFSTTTEALERRCKLLRLAGYRHVKVKVGRSDDLARVAIVRHTLGDALELRLDANAAWDADEAIDHLQAMKRFGVLSVEQPVAAADLVGMRKVREHTNLPVVADESLCSLQDALAILAAGAADIFNIRIGKCGGLLGSKRLADLARRHGLRCHLGALVGETGILTRAGELFAQRTADIEFFEGNGQNLLVEDVVERSRTCGLGLSIRNDSIARFSTLAPRDANMVRSIE